MLPAIKGVVTGPSSELLSGIVVTPYSYDSGSKTWDAMYDEEARTRSDGTYALYLPAGAYRVGYTDADHHRFADEFWNDRSTVYAASTIDLGATDQSKNARLALRPTISGTVTNDRGRALAGIEVRAYAGSAQVVEHVETTTNGSYSLPVDPSTRYQLEFVDLATGIHRTEFWNDQPTLASATSISVSATTVSGKDAVLAINPTISGTVRSDAGAEIDDAQVVVLRRDPDATSEYEYSYFSSAYTGVDGRYRAPVEAGGTYKLEFREDDFETEYFDDTTDLAAATTMAVTGDVTGKNAALAPLTAITGKVTSPAGPVRTYVTAYQLRRIGFGSYWAKVRGVDTRADGTYSIKLPPSTYRLGFADTDDAWGEFHVDKPTVAQGTTITLTEAGDQVANAVLAGKTRVSGKVTGPDGKPLAGAVATFYRGEPGEAGTTVYRSFDEAESDETGAYRLAVPTGSYKVGFSAGGYRPEFYDDVANLAAAAAFTVDGADVTGRSAVLARASAIRGTVTDINEATLTGMTVTAEALTDDGDGGSEWVSVASAKTAADGRYALHVAPGSYRLRFSDASHRHRTEYYDDQVSPERSTLVTVASSDVTVRNALLGLNPTVTGTVTRAGGTGLDGIAVTLLVDGRAVNDTEWTTYSSGTTAANGTYEIAAPAGAYKLAFEDRGAGVYRTEFYDDKSTVEQGVLLQLTAAGLPSRNAELAPRATISGTVSGPAKAAPGVVVDVYASPDDGAPGSWKVVTSTTTSSSGTYSVPVQDGTYRLGFSAADGSFLPECWNDQQSIEDAADIVVSGSAVTGKNAQLANGSGVTGTVTVPGESRPAATVTAFRKAGDGAWTAAGEAHASNGSYRLPLPPGTYRFRFSADNGAFAPVFSSGSATFGGARDVIVATDAYLPNIDATFGAGTAVTSFKAPTVSGTPAVGSLLTLADGTWAPDPVTRTYRWLRDGSPIAGATASTYTPTSSDVGARISVEVKGAKSGLLSLHLTTAETAVVAPSASAVTSSKAPSISGTPTFDQTLTANDGTWGPGSVTMTRRWLRDGVPIPGATASSYRLTADEVGKTVSVEVTGAKSGLTSLTRTSSATAPVAALTLTATAVPTITGPETPVAGSVLTVKDGTWGPDPVTLTHQWLRDGTAIKNASGSTHTVTAGDHGTTITVRTTGTRPGYATEAKTSAGIAVRRPTLPTVTSSAAPSISGTPVVGGTLTAGDGSWAEDSVTTVRAWLRNGVAIAGATGTTYVPTTDDVGSRISLRVTGTKSGFDPSTTTSAPTDVVTAPVTATPSTPAPAASPSASPPPAVAKVAPTVRVTAKGAKKKATLTIAVAAAGVTPTGTVTVRLGSKVLKTVTLRNGRAKVTIKKQKKGKKTFTVVYAGDGQVLGGAGRSRKIVIR